MIYYTTINIKNLTILIIGHVKAESLKLLYCRSIVIKFDKKNLVGFLQFINKLPKNKLYKNKNFMILSSIKLTKTMLILMRVPFFSHELI